MLLSLNMTFQPTLLSTLCRDVLLSEVSKRKISFLVLKCLPKSLYLELFYEYIEEEKHWEQLFETFFGCQEEDALDQLYDLSLEQAIILQNHPEKCPEFGYEKNYFILTTYSVNFSDDKSAYCYECCQNFQKQSTSLNKVIIETVNISIIDIEDLLPEIKDNDSNWCNDCLYKPLFRVEEVTENKRQIVYRNYLYEDTK